MWIQPGALPQVPAYAVIEEREVDSARKQLMDESRRPPQARLDATFRLLECDQPELAAFLANELANVEGHVPQALLYTLFLAVFVAFRGAFGARLRRVADADIHRALDQLIVDSEIRGQIFAARGFSEDVIALGQPALMRFVTAELEEAQPPAEAVAPIMEGLLIAVLALQAGVAPA